MVRRSHSFTDRLSQILFEREHTKQYYIKALKLREYRIELSNRLRHLSECLEAEKGVKVDIGLRHGIIPLDKENATYRMIVEELFSLSRSFWEGFAIGITGLISGAVSDILLIAMLRAYVKLRFENAWTWRGYMVNALYDTLYTVVCRKYEDVIKSLYYACEYANRFVKLIEGYESHTKSMAHEYCSWMRRLRCHLSQVSFKLTPLTMIVAQNKHGNIYVAVHMHSRVLNYSPYARRIYGLPPHYTIILRRKPDISFSSRIDAGVIIAKFDANVVSARDFADRPYTVRRLIELLFRPYIIARDKSRSLGMPENSHNIGLCSVYFIPRSTKSKKLRNTTNATIRILSKPKIYFRQPKI